MAENITVTILTKNSEKHLKECLEALELFDEIVVLDNGSTDDTIRIARSYPNVRIVEHEFIGFGPLKVLATRNASHDWVLSIDSDEIVTRELVEEIRALHLEKKTVYAMRRDNYYNRSKIIGCGWENDWVNRLFNRQETGFNTKLVHESLELKNDMDVKRLQNPIKHYTFDNASHLIKKMEHYSTLWAEDHKGKKTSSLLKAVSRGIFTFFKSYILQKGLFSGYSGMVISVSNANGAFYKYIKLYEANKTAELQPHNNNL